MGQHQEHRPLRWLLEDLEDRIRRIAVQIIGRVDDDDAPVAGSRGLGEEVSGLAHLVNGDRRLDPSRLLVDGRDRCSRL